MTKLKILKMEPKATDGIIKATHQAKGTSNEDIVQVMEETQESEAQSKIMKPTKFDPAVFFAQDEMQLNMMEAEIVDIDDGNDNKRSGSSTLIQHKLGFQHPFETDVELKKPKHAKSVTALQTLQTKWNFMFHRLTEYKQVHGNCLVPNRYKCDLPLGLWVSTQRRQVCFYFAC